MFDIERNDNLTDYEPEACVAVVPQRPCTCPASLVWECRSPLSLSSSSPTDHKYYLDHDKSFPEAQNPLIKRM